jgi:hypothetical protein
MRAPAAVAVSVVAITLLLPLPLLAQAPADPGTGPWTLVDEDSVATTCRLDLDRLNEVMLPPDQSFAIVRYGQLCFVSGPDAWDGAHVSHLFSATKTLGALLTGAVMYESRNLPASDAPRRGPLTEFDRMDKWIDLTNLPDEAVVNPDATVAHVLAMVGYSDDLSHGQKQHEYDATGRREINQLIRVIDSVVRQDPGRLGSNAVEAKDRLFAKLGLEHSRWNVDYFGYSWYASLLDMARVGLAVLHGGVYDGERIADADYVYNMTHPAFEDGSTRYGYLTWMNNTSCSPRAIHASYPHGLSEATDCADGNCDQEHDIGVWNALGAGGQVIQGHRGLDMVVVGKNWSNAAEALWQAVLPAIVAGDPTYRGDQDAFCETYAAGAYAPDLVPWLEEQVD